MKALKRKSASIPNSRWLAYATAGAASAFTGANSAEATIHYCGKINRRFDHHDTVQFQLDQPGDSFRLKHYLYFSSAGYGGSARFGIVGKAAASFAGFYGTCYGNPVTSASKLGRAQLISNRPFLPRQSGLLAGLPFFAGCGSLGQFDQTRSVSSVLSSTTEAAINMVGSAFRWAEREITISN